MSMSNDVVGGIKSLGGCKIGLVRIGEGTQLDIYGCHQDGEGLVWGHS